MGAPPTWQRSAARLQRVQQVSREGADLDLGEGAQLQSESANTAYSLGRWMQTQACGKASSSTAPLPAHLQDIICQEAVVSAALTSNIRDPPLPNSHSLHSAPAGCHPLRGGSRARACARPEPRAKRRTIAASLAALVFMQHKCCSCCSRFCRYSHAAHAGQPLQKDAGYGTTAGSI